jgi:hypothetical protein
MFVAFHEALILVFYYCVSKVCRRHSRNRSRQTVLEILSRFVREQSLETLKGCLVVADEIQTRIRRSQ